ncbi:efflux transporter outer membrane subunit [Stenotrophomonas rhizophila]|uniref:efflux transporter outer membrane subunit n=1 Tax=Stenotrophomonas rhizophila TaxID=216778 RepID=UPI002795FE03|nr:TolC family protein [Stenotrophomonas rhizophila]MCC7635386.1 TolC family protein [Stenotrophomonas rhizophila]MCC7664385.1 TolC family protein [Stenotrophomonas rhizophila]
MSRRRGLLIVLPLGAGLLLSACASVGPDVSRPSPPHLPSAAFPADFGARPAALLPGAVDAAWWQSFDDPALTALIPRAWAANHDIGLATARLDEARAMLRESRQGFLPQGGAGVGHENRRRSETETAPGQPRRSETYRAAVDASWEIDLFGRVRRSAEAARADAGARQALLRDVQASVAAAVAASWFELSGLDAELEVVAAIAQSQRDGLRLVEGLADAGSATALDRLRAEAALHAVDAVAPELERRRTAAFNALALLLGQTPQTFAAPASPTVGQALAVRSIVVGDPAALLARRPDIEAAELRLAAATARIGVETAGLYPQLEIQGSIGVVAGSLASTGGSSALSSLLAPLLRWSFLDTGRARARIAASEARAREALIHYDQTVLRALEETDNAFAAYGAAGTALQLRAREAAATGQAAGLARAQFAHGEGLYLEVLEAERADFASRRALVVARTEQRLAIVSIYKALGGGWVPCTEAGSACGGASGAPEGRLTGPVPGP